MSPGLDSNVENITTRSIDANILPSEHDRQAYRFARSPSMILMNTTQQQVLWYHALQVWKVDPNSGAGAAVAGTAVAAGNYIRTGGEQMQIIQDDTTMENASRNSTVRSSMSSEVVVKQHVPTISSTSSGSDYKHFQPASSNNPFAAAACCSSQHNKGTSKIFDEHIGDFDKPRGIEQRYGSTASVATSPYPGYQDHDSHSKKTAKRSEYLGRKRTVTQSPQVKNHSWAKFGSLMILGLVVPPIYLLITCGLFDNNRRSSSQYYSGISYYNEKKRAARDMKIISCLVGLAWFAIVLAMIGLAFGLRG
ncbi:hypothetical protein G9P44_005142 [Scheffersomyces stipitis]|nr:hypothetical protein G9P44_005142 [Scheffersomyces stipitis]